MSNKNAKTEPKPETASGSGSTDTQSGGTPPPVESKADGSAPVSGAEETASDPPRGGSEQPAAPVAADPSAPARKEEWPRDIRIVNNTSMPLSLPGIRASVSAYGGTSTATINTPDEATRLRTDLAQLAELHRWPDDAVEISLL